MKVTLIRTSYTPCCTLGELDVHGVRFFTLEEPWKNNERNVSCIPPGEYLVKPHNWNNNSLAKFKRVWHITDVPNRDAILIHGGNTTSDISGCVLVGLKRGKLNDMPAVLDSQKAITMLRSAIGNKEFTLIIKDTVCNG